MPVHAFIFPGQGSQAVGMGRDLAAAFAAAREVFEEVDETLKQKLSKLMFEGPGEELIADREHPAGADGDLARRAAGAGEGGRLHAARRRRSLVAGHSLGEYSALAAAGSFSIADAARLLKLRGQAMQKAVPAGEGAMAALLGAEMAAGGSDLRRGRAGAGQRDRDRRADEVVEPANDNGGGQVVVSGHRGAVERAVEIAKAKGVRRAMLLPVSAPFHCALMAPAADAMAEALENDPAARADRAADRQCLGRQGDRSGRDPRPAGPPGHRHGALARVRAGDGGDWAWTASSNSGAGKVLSRARARASRPTPPPPRPRTPAEIEARAEASGWG